MTVREARIKYNGLWYKYEMKRIWAKEPMRTIYGLFAMYYWETYCYWRDKE
jgi:hypothetical protein